MVGVYCKALSWWYGMDMVYLLLVKVANGGDGSRLLEIVTTHLEVHGAVAVGIACVWGWLALAIRRKFGNLG